MPGSGLVQPARQLSKWVIAPDGWRDAWDAAKAACLTTPAWCTYVGDSNPFGLGCTDVMSTSVPELLRNYWRNTLGYPWYADYWPMTYSNDFHVQFGVVPPGTMPWSVMQGGSPIGTTTALSGTGSVMTYTMANKLIVGQPVTIAGATPSGYNTTGAVVSASSTQFTLSGATTGAQTVAGSVSAPTHAWAVYGLIRSFWAQAAITANTMATFTTPFNTYVQMELLYTDWFSGTWTYTDPGGTRRTVTNTGTAKLTKASTGMTGLSATSHTLKPDGMTLTSSTFANALLSGVSCYESTTAGIGLSRVIATGGSYADFVQAGIPADECSIFAGSGITTPGVAAGLTFPVQSGALFISHLAINDCQADRGVAMTQDTLRRQFAAARRGYANCSLMLILAYHPDMTVSDQVTGWTDWQNWNLYCRSLREVAAEYGACVVDLHAKWGYLAFTNGLLKSNADPHMNDAGSLDLFNLLISPAVGI